MRFYLITLLVFLFYACSSGLEESKKFEAYDGPIMEADTVEILYSDSAVVRVLVKASKQYDYENGDREFPNDIFIEFYETDGTLSSTLEANSAYFTEETGIYKAEGDVEVIGYIDPRKMNSEELYWDPNKEEIYTEKFVRIQSEDQISTGTGLVAKQDFSSYKILNPSGTIYLDDDNPDSVDNIDSIPEAQPTIKNKPDSQKISSQRKNVKKRNELKEEKE